MSVESEILKRLERLERKVDILVRNPSTCTCATYQSGEYEGTWYCAYHGSVRGWWENHQYNMEYEEEL